MLTHKKSEKSSPPHHNISDLMRLCGFNKAELARRVDVHPNTVTKWCDGTTRVPGAVVAYLGLYATLKRATD